MNVKLCFRFQRVCAFDSIIMVKRKVIIGRHSQRKLADIKRSRNSAADQSNVDEHFRFRYDIDEDYAAFVTIGECNRICPSCSARLFPNESYNKCCHSGKVQLEPLPNLPTELSNLLSNSHFLKNVRKYNNAFAMTSLGCQEEWTYTTFKISGKLYHRIGSLLPISDKDSKFLQVYFIGNSEEEVAKRRENTDSDLDEAILQQLQILLHEQNEYVRLFKCAYEEGCQLQGDVQVVIRDSIIPTIHKGCTNGPTSDEVSVFIPGLHEMEYQKRDIIIQCK